MDNSTSAIKKFYSNRSILITGVTGFVGKVIINDSINFLLLLVVHVTYSGRPLTNM